MNAPDKIFILYHEDYSDRRILNAFTEKDDDTDIEYIRKDALLEWAREKRERLGKMFDAMPATAIGAKLDACKEFIEKIESL